MNNVLCYAMYINIGCYWFCQIIHTQF